MVLIWKLLHYDIWRGLWFVRQRWEYVTLSAACCEHDTLSAVIIAAVTVAAITVYVPIGIAIVTAAVIIATDVKSIATSTVASAATIVATFSAVASQTLLRIGLNWRQHAYKCSTNRLIGKLAF